MTQLLSIEGQKLIAQLRRNVQEHIGRLPVTYYDANKTGQMVSRIMSDVEGMRNLVGTGVIEFLGGLLTAGLGLFLAFRISPLMTGLALGIVVVFGAVLSKAFKTVRPIFRERAKINAEVTGRLTESLGGVRVVKGYHAEESEAQVFAVGVKRLLDNVRRSLTTMSLMALSATVLMGMVGALIMYLGTQQIYAGKLTIGQLVAFNAYLIFMIAPIMGIVNIGTQMSEALAGLERTREVLRERPEDEDPERTFDIGPIEGEVIFDNVEFAYESGPTVLHGISFKARPGTCGCSICRPVGIRQIDHHRPHCRFSQARGRPDPCGRSRFEPRQTAELSHATGCCSAGVISLRRLDPRECYVLAP